MPLATIVHAESKQGIYIMPNFDATLLGAFDDSSSLGIERPDADDLKKSWFRFRVPQYFHA